MDQTVSPVKMSQKDLLIVIVIALGSFMAGLDATIVNIALPDIAKFFEVSTVAVSWVLNGYLIILVSLLLAATLRGQALGIVLMLAVRARAPSPSEGGELAII